MDTWMGEDIERLPREKLIEIIRQLGQQLEETRAAAERDIKFFREVAKLKEKFR